MNKTLYIVTMGAELCRALNHHGRPIGDPPLSVWGMEVMKLVRPIVNSSPLRQTSDVYCGTGRRFLQAAELIFPGKEDLHFSPVFGETLIELVVDQKPHIVFGTGRIFPRDAYYDRLLPTISDDTTMQLLRTSTVDSVLNLPDHAVVITEKRALQILDMPDWMFAPGAAYLAKITGCYNPVAYEFLGGPRPGLLKVA